MPTIQYGAIRKLRHTERGVWPSVIRCDKRSNAQTLCHTVEFSTHAHKRVPSVYAGTEIKPNDIAIRQAVSYSGPTYLATRSGSTPHPQLFY